MGGERNVTEELSVPDGLASVESLTPDRPVESPPSNRASLFAVYYLATPLFVVADALLGVNIRIAALPDASSRGAYYLFAFACGILCRWRPRITPVVGILESSLNVLLLVLSVMLPLFELQETVFTDEPWVTPFSAMSLGNFILSGAVLVASFHLHMANLTHRRA